MPLRIVLLTVFFVALALTLALAPAWPHGLLGRAIETGMLGALAVGIGAWGRHRARTRLTVFRRPKDTPTS